MRLLDGRLTASPTDLANFLACRHKTALDRLVAEGRLAKPTSVDPLADVLRQRGEEHERRYVDKLRAEGLTIVDLGAAPHDERPAKTLKAMRDGADVIVQATLTDDQWLGHADVLRKVYVPSATLGAWSYEAYDTKLSRETRGGTILQLCVYTELLGQIQGHAPEFFRVVTPVSTEPYRFDDFGAFYRQVKARFLTAMGRTWEPRSPGTSEPTEDTYPDPVDHCSVCRWSSRCNAQRRRDDHLSFVAGLGRHHQTELTGQGVTTVAALAKIPIPLEFRPTRGAKTTYERLREQARLLVAQRASGHPTFELLPIEREFGLTQLPEPRPGDLFLDLEGDPFARQATGLRPGEGAREYLFGLGRVATDGSFTYTARWAFTDIEEHTAFEAVVTEIMAALESDPSIHVYHYAPYEPSAFKRLMGRYAVREADVDRLLRGGRFVDLYAIARHAVRAGVENYSIKSLEPFYAFEREVELSQAGDRRRIVEVALETNDASLVTPEICATVEAYNRDDCRSTLELRGWLESLRDGQIVKGAEVPRPPLEPDEPSQDVTDRQQRVSALRLRLLANVPGDLSDRSTDQRALYLLAYILDWHYREDKVVWWEYFRLLKLSDEELLDEANAVAGLEFVGRIDVIRHKTSGKGTGSVVDRYRYPPQECEIRRGCELTLRNGTVFGAVLDADRDGRTLDVRKGPKAAAVHPCSAFVHEHFSPKEPAGALFRLGAQVAAHGLESAPRAAVDLLLRHTPHTRGATSVREAEAVVDYAVRTAGDLDETTLPIQGPPGSGKTFTGARMICALVEQGRRVGVTATGHKVIRNLLHAVAREAAKQGRTVRLGHKVGDASDGEQGDVEQFLDNEVALNAIGNRTIDVLGGTVWLWSREEFRNSVDVLFIDEAGQMSLANALAVSQAASSLVLLGDPQQLEQPQQGSHPDGVGTSALDHVLEGYKTMPASRGLFLPITWRLAPAICKFTSEVFYEGKLASKAGLERQRLAGAGRFDGSGLFVVEVEHDGCRNASDAEAAVVTGIVDALLEAGVRWIDEVEREHQMTTADILVVAPYNAHVNRVQERLAGRARPVRVLPEAVHVGTVDKCQGREAPVVIYSTATSRPEDAPRGMEFLYNLNRLNVATSRARCVCILVTSPRLFEPECRTPHQMQLANALARYREIAKGR